MNSLTKENFWNDLMAKYPEEMKEFCNWIDGYKKRVGWNTLFSVNVKTALGTTLYEIKYHDLPIAMQIGIFMQFAAECNWFAFLEVNIADVADWELMPAQIQDFFKEEHEMRLRMKGTKQQSHGKQN